MGGLNPRRKGNGFALAKLLVVVGILAVLAVLFFPAFSSARAMCAYDNSELLPPRGNGYGKTTAPIGVNCLFYDRHVKLLRYGQVIAEAEALPLPGPEAR